MSAFLRSHSRVAAIALAVSIGAASLATPAFAVGGSAALWPHGGHSFSHNGGNFRSGGNFRGRGGWGPGIGAAVVGGLIGGAIIGSAGYPYYDNGYASDPCVQYQDVYSSAGVYLGRQPVNTCQ